MKSPIDKTARVTLRPGQLLVAACMAFIAGFTWSNPDQVVTRDNPLDQDTGAIASDSPADMGWPAQERQLKQLITDLEQAKGTYAPDLQDPLIDLARIYADTGRIDKAHETLRRAQHLMHRQDGVYALRQLEVIDLLFQLEMNDGKFPGAENQQQFALFISEHNTGADDPELLPALHKMARWQFETGQYQSSRKTLTRAMDIITSKLGANDPRMVEFLTLQARTRQLEGGCCVAEILEQARAILEANPSQNDEYPTLLFSLADAYIADREPELAAELYHRAATYQTLQSSQTAPDNELPPRLIPTYGQLKRFTPHKQVYVPKKNSLDYFPSRQALLERQGFEEQPREEIFVIPFEDHQYNVRLTSNPRNRGSESLHVMVGEPVQFELGHLQEILPASYLHGTKLAETRIQLTFSVLADGTVTNLDVVSSNAPNKLQQLVKRALSMSKFRPRLVNGNAVDTHQLEIMQTFSPINDMISPQEN